MVTKCFQNYSVFNSKFCKGRLHIKEIHKEDNVDSVDNNVDNVDNVNNINADIDTEKSRYRRRLAIQNVHFFKVYIF